MRVTTLVHFLPFLPLESFERRKMGKTRTKTLRVVAFFESLYYDLTAEVSAIFLVWLQYRNHAPRSQPPVYGR